MFCSPLYLLSTEVVFSPSEVLKTWKLIFLDMLLLCLRGVEIFSPYSILLYGLRLLSQIIFPMMQWLSSSSRWIMMHPERPSLTHRKEWDALTAFPNIQIFNEKIFFPHGKFRLQCFLFLFCQNYPWKSPWFFLPVLNPASQWQLFLHGNVQFVTPPPPPISRSNFSLPA